MSIDMQQIILGDMSIDVVHKDIKNVHLSVYPPKGKVKISAPLRMNLDTIRVFAISKMSWINKQQIKLQNQESETPRDYITREGHYYLGKQYLLKVIEHNTAPKVLIKHETIELYIRPGTNSDKRKIILDEWYRKILKEIIFKVITRYEESMKVDVVEFGIKKMKTKWGTCNIETKKIWLNLELAKKPRKCIEYVVVHEMTHLLERHHNKEFIAYLSKFFPKWKFYREMLNKNQLHNEKLLL
jgi:predicted metal-dependent hydrolase